MRVTVYEQGHLALGSRADEAAGCLSLSQASNLVELGERIKAKFVSWQSPVRLRVEQFVGVVGSRDLQVEILPKLEGLSEPAQVRRNLLAMLAETHDLEVKASDVVGYLVSDESFLRALARLYCERLLEFVRRGLRQEYVLHQSLLPHVRGKIDWPSQAKLVASQRLEFPCIFDDRSEDTPLNRTLKAALVKAQDILEGSHEAGRITELRHAMFGVSDLCPIPEQVARLHTDRTNRSLEPVLVLAKLILGNLSPDLGRTAQGKQNSYALVWDMNVLFEEYVGRLAKRQLMGKSCQVDLQEEAASHLAVEVQGGRKVFHLRPDLLVRVARKAIVVADTKWKRLDPHRGNLGISPADVYQVLA